MISHAVAHAALVVLVVRLELHGAFDDLFVERVLHAVLNGDDDGLIHLVGLTTMPTRVFLRFLSLTCLILPSLTLRVFQLIARA